MFLSAAYFAALFIVWVGVFLGEGFRGNQR